MATIFPLFIFSISGADKGIERRNVEDMSGMVRAALVIGNADYGAGRLKNPVNDARDVAQTLKELGFDVDLKTDCNRLQMETAIRDFGDRLRGGDKVGVFYFSGHGIRVGGRNYLLPVGANIEREDEVPYQAVPADLALAKMRSAKNPLNLVILDACRNNPYARSWNRSEGDQMLGSMTPPSGTLILYAASPGGVARDGDGKNSPFTASLKQWMKTPGLDVYRLASTVANDVIRDTDGRQRPWMEGMILGDFYFADSGGAVVETPAPRPEKKEASLSITSDVAGATVWINGQEMGGSPPLNFPSIGPGHYRVKVGKAGYDPYERRLEVKPGKSYAVTAHLEKTEEAPAPVAPIPPPEPAARGRFTNSLGMEFVRIPAGSFTMGSPEDEPGRYDREKQHRVTLTRDYFMQATEVTQGQWKAVMGSNPSHFKNCGDDCPVEKVSWNDAQEFIEKLNRREGESYRLPTEAEWEYAARAGTTTPFTYGRCLSTDQANYDGDPPLDRCPKGKDRGKTIPVGSLNAPNAWGLHDMSGNVYEWCQDWYGDYPDNASVDPGGPSDAPYRVIRGGSWSPDARFCRSAYRSSRNPSNRDISIGFRLAVSPGR